MKPDTKDSLGFEKSTAPPEGNVTETPVPGRYFASARASSCLARTAGTPLLAVTRSLCAHTAGTPLVAAATFERSLLSAITHLPANLTYQHALCCGSVKNAPS